MKITEISEILAGEMQKYTDDMRDMFPEGDNTPVTKGDIHAFSRDTFFLMRSIQTKILAYLEEIEDEKNSGL